MAEFKPPKPPQPIARKCIVCGTTKHECNMKPFLLKGDQLNLWTSSYFGSKRNKLCNFYSKLRYTLNPYSCIEHFVLTSTPYPGVAKNSKRCCIGLISENEEPPSIEKITEKKPDSPLPPEPANERSEQEINAAVMSILKKARAEMDNDEERRKVLMSISRRMVDKETEHRYLTNSNSLSSMLSDKKKKKKSKKKQRKRRKREKEREEAEKKEKEKTCDGNEADESDDSEDEIDVEGIDSSESSSEEEKETTSGDSDSDESSSGEEPDAPVDPSVAPPARVPLPATPLPKPIRRFLLNGKPFPSRTYKISDPVAMAALRERCRLMGGAAIMPRTNDGRPGARPNVPRRLTPSPVVPTYQRPSWITPTPVGAQTLASVLQRFWNEDMMAPINTGPPAPKLTDPGAPKPSTAPSTFGRLMLPGMTTKFVPASRIAPPPKPPPTVEPTWNDTPMASPGSRSVISNPPLSPSRLIVGSEETVETTTLSDEEKVELMSSSSSSSEESDVEVDVHSEGAEPPAVPEGQQIEGVVVREEEEKTEAGDRSRSLSIGTTIMSDEDGEDIDVDVVTVEEEKKDGVTDAAKMLAAAAVAGRIPVEGLKNEKTIGAMVKSEQQRHKDRRKQCLSAYRSSGGKPHYYVSASQHRRIILPPSAGVKPPTRLLSSGIQYPMRELLHAQSRTATVHPVRLAARNMHGGVMAPFKRRPARPNDMPTLTSEARATRVSEWSRLEKVVEAKMAAQREQKEVLKRKQLANMVDPRVMAENPPPVLVPAEEGKTEARKSEGRMMGGTDFALDHGFKEALVNSIVEGKEERQRSKVLRMRFHRKEGEVDVSKMKVLDRSTCPQGVGREEEVDACPDYDTNISLRTKERREKEIANRDANQIVKKMGPQVKNPQLVIIKKDILAYRQLQASKNAPLIEPANAPENVPPPTPVVGLPDQKERSARRLMFEQKRQDLALMAASRSGGRLKMSEEEWRKKKMAELCGLAEKTDRDGVPFENKDEAALEAEVLEIVRKVKAAKRKMAEMEVTTSYDTEEDDGVLVMSDIEDETEEETEPQEKTKEGEKEKEQENREKKDKDEDFVVEEEEDEEKEGSGEVKRRTSTRLKIKRKMSKRANIWTRIADEEAAALLEEAAESGKKKRGRPRKHPEGTVPPRKKTKRVEKEHMTDVEKEVLARLLKKDNDADVGDADKGKETEDESMNGEEKEKEIEKEETEGVEEEEKEREKEEDDKLPDLVFRSKRKKRSWSWKERLDHDLTVNNEMGGRLCNYCMKHSKRYIWVANCAVALMDHARTHCVETLMCPNANCTYMNTQRSRISQHVSYVHKKWGMPIDLAELYPSMRASLMMRLRQSFPDMPNVAVCRMCRVAVRPERKLLRSHAQSHLLNQVFECSRDICKHKFTTEQECLDHIQRANCRGTVKSGMTDEMADEVTQLMDECFDIELEAPSKEDEVANRVEEMEEEEADKEVHSSTPSTASKPSSQQGTEGEEEKEEETMDR